MAYFLCTAHEEHLILERVADGLACDALGGTRYSSSLCIVSEDVCTAWEEATVQIAPAPELPSVADGAELYAWGFGAVLVPALLLWVAAVIVAGIQRIRQS